MRLYATTTRMTAISRHAEAGNFHSGLPKRPIKTVIPMPSIAETPKPRGTATESPATEIAPIKSMLARLKIAPAANANSHCRLPECIRSSTNEKPSNPRLPTVSAQTTATIPAPMARSK